MDVESTLEDADGARAEGSGAVGCLASMILLQASLHGMLSQVAARARQVQLVCSMHTRSQISCLTGELWQPPQSPQIRRPELGDPVRCHVVPSIVHNHDVQHHCSRLQGAGQSSHSCKWSSSLAVTVKERCTFVRAFCLLLCACVALTLNLAKAPSRLLCCLVLYEGCAQASRQALNPLPLAHEREVQKFSSCTCYCTYIAG